MKLVIAFLAALLLAVPAAAELSLQECIDIAMKNQIDVLVGSDSLDAAKARKAQVMGEYYPQVGVQLANEWAGSSTTNGTSVSVTQNFYDGGLREAKVRGAASSISESRYGLDRTGQTVTFNVTRDYFALLRSKHLADVQRASVKYLEGQLDMVRTRVRLGDAAAVDALPVEAQLANARVDLLAAENAIRTSSIQLQNTMGLSPDPAFSIKEVGEPKEIGIEPADTYVTSALDDRPEVRQTKAGVDAARSGVDAARIAKGPHLQVSGQYDKSMAGTLGSLSRNDGEFLISAGLVYDLFDGGINQAAYREQLSNLSSAGQRAAQTEKDIRSEVQQAYLDLTNAKERMAASDLSLTAARTNLDAQEGRYKQGLAIPLDLLNAQLGVTTAESNAVQARYDYYTSIARLEYAIGKPGGLYAN
ncbi:MAG: TolC family protein [Armatimonadota bacterium]